eukprot:NODE_28_length_38599_cov_0.791792.p5 type:complete len:659 gc:universal NODE_28_length_38599_cov_0.791792:30543-32519(+)
MQIHNLSSSDGNEIEHIFDLCISDVENNQNKTDNNKDLQKKALWKFREFCTQENITQHSQLREASLKFLQKDTFSGTFTKAGVKPAVFRFCEIANVRAPSTDEIKDQSHKIVASRLRSRTVNKSVEVEPNVERYGAKFAKIQNLSSSEQKIPIMDSDENSLAVNNLIESVIASFPQKWSDSTKTGTASVVRQFGRYMKNRNISEVIDMIPLFIKQTHKSKRSFYLLRSRLRTITNYLDIPMPDVDITRNQFSAIQVRGHKEKQITPKSKVIPKAKFTNHFSLLNKTIDSVRKTFKDFAKSTVAKYDGILNGFTMFCKNTTIESQEQLLNASLNFIDSFEPGHQRNKAKIVLKKVLISAEIWEENLFERRTSAVDMDLSEPSIISVATEKSDNVDRWESPVKNEKLTANIKQPKVLENKSNTFVSIDLLCASVLEKSPEPLGLMQQDIFQFKEYFNLHQYGIDEIELAITNYKEDLLREKEFVLSKIYNTFLFMQRKNIENLGTPFRSQIPLNINPILSNRQEQTPPLLGRSLDVISPINYATKEKVMVQKRKTSVLRDRKIRKHESEIRKICDSLLANTDYKPSTMEHYSRIINRFVQSCHSWNMFDITQLKQGIRRYVAENPFPNDRTKCVLRKLALAAKINAVDILGKGRATKLIK